MSSTTTPEAMSARLVHRLRLEGRGRRPRPWADLGPAVVLRPPAVPRAGEPPRGVWAADSGRPLHDGYGSGSGSSPS